QMLSVGLDRRRQLGDIEFSNRYAEFLRLKPSTAPSAPSCAACRAGVGGDVERVNLLLRQYMCPSVFNNWSAALQMLSVGLDRRRQLGDIEFSNRYAEFLRLKAKHSSVCAFLRRMQGVKKSGVGGDVERVNLLLRQYMCPSVFNNWSAAL
ncbi:hypothetical protein KUCAC02_036109, partial [Chaenocephalus aceratus]